VAKNAKITRRRMKPDFFSSSASFMLYLNLSKSRFLCLSPDKPSDSSFERSQKEGAIAIITAGPIWVMKSINAIP